MNEKKGHILLNPDLWLVLIVIFLTVFSGCASRSLELSPEEALMPEVPVLARLTLEELTAGGQIEVLRREELGGKVVYHLEARVDDEDVTYDIACDGSYERAPVACRLRKLPFPQS